MHTPSFTCNYHRDDLLKPGRDVKSKTVVVDETSEIDPSPIYKKPHTCKMEPVKVSELIHTLESEGSTDDNCRILFDRTQREAVRRALLQPLSLIQVDLSKLWQNIGSSKP